ncbi:long-chain-acyl-CoA synthetase [Gammaproteobacteria bacterium]|nr:long-chain-acyl-CoA synthetase [Gammaproteobacteria bacterium]MDA8865530.1 long-chain-acyl-CoA synthetase [Gammaproteobacteria bacterium]MDA9221220.1 long-chain-acyl-CoA synthetase [Gammaproteobacteria bacterium]MDB3914896.1 long-chain-acyl-CoA synthetase [Gammaproteobacteria bacterium]MDC3325938.1 long-chain-acyl-CoA synthetase [Gammaproteobacteria bacterium]
MFSKMKEFFRVLGEFKQIIPVLKYKFPLPDESASLAHSFEKSVAKYANKNFLIFEEDQLSYDEANKSANVLANFLSSEGVQHQDRVVLFMQNRTDYVISLLALNKIGAIGVLINNSLTGAPLIHCINSSDSKKCIVGEELTQELSDVLSDINITDKDDIYWVEDSKTIQTPEWATNLRSSLDYSKNENLVETDNVTAKDTAFYIFTSGTTGVPKAAIFPNAKIVAASFNISNTGYRMTHEDRLYNCLPLYHSTGLMLGLAAVIHSGASVFVRRKFSASMFWKEAQRYQTTTFIYVGELCRYLSFQEPCEDEKNNPIRAMVGNGLRPDLWDCFRDRFGVERICEIYGASEGACMFMNGLNKDKTIGMTNATVVLLKYDVASDELIKNDDGLCIEAEDEMPGLLAVKISPDSPYNGYTDKKESEKKILRNVLEEGDAWFNSGDLIKTMDVGFSVGQKHYQFVDRIGDTFRWKSENVSTNEVAEIINQYSQVNMANVYGVQIPNAEGRAGMVAFNCDLNEFNWDNFAEYMSDALPSYARPVFVRIIKELETTGTFKLKKNELRDEAYHLDKVSNDKVFIKKPGTNSYVELDNETYQDIANGSVPF